MGGFGIGQVCLNGHAITGFYQPGGPFSEDFCSDCGQRTITACEGCGSPIKGDYDASEDEIFTSVVYLAPRYCTTCGAPFPWTASAIEAAKELADEIDGIGEDARSKAKDSFVDLASDTPKTQLAIVRVKKLLAAAAPAVADGLKQVLVSIATDTAKKQLGL